ncbi:MAG: hypothetical protein JW769_04115 [Parachlamydiales bacterium]|nr:hypothetical protein [Parachlamydiales bacterium]
MKLFITLFNVSKRFFVIVFILMSALFIAKGWQLISDGFRQDKIYHDFPHESQWEVSFSPQQEKEIMAILDQPFHYLGKGCQVYVFASQDQKYVIKFIRYHKYRLPFWIAYTDFFQKGKEYVVSRRDHRQRGYYNSLRSYKIAYEQLPEETATLYIHLNRTFHLHKKLPIIDRLGRHSSLDLDNTGFIVQKRVMPLEPYLLQMKKDQKTSETEKIIGSFLEMVEHLYDKGMTNKDYNCLKNAGYLEGKIIAMDIGSFYPQNGLEDPHEFQKELINFVKHFRRWSQKKYPQILFVFDEKVDQLIEKKRKQCTKES